MFEKHNLSKFRSILEVNSITSILGQIWTFGAQNGTGSEIRCCIRNRRQKIPLFLYTVCQVSVCNSEVGSGGENLVTMNKLNLSTWRFSFFPYRFNFAIEQIMGGGISRHTDIFFTVETRCIIMQSIIRNQWSMEPQFLLFVRFSKIISCLPQRCYNLLFGEDKSLGFFSQIRIWVD